MAQVPPPTPYRLIYDLLVEHVSGRSDDDRFLWLENADLKSLIPYLTAKQQGTLFARELLVAAYLHSEINDGSLRHLLILLRNTHSGHPDTVASINDLLAHPDLRPLLFPAGIPDTDNPTLLRAHARFRQMPSDPDTPLPDVAPLPPPYHMRLDRNTDFVGREMELREIARAMKEGRGAVVAAGIGGVGKTQTAIEWVHRYGQYFAGGVFWLDFQNADTARLSIATAGIAYGWEAYNALDLDTQVAKVRNQWNEPIPTLLVLDNCEDINLAYEYVPVGSGAKVLLTSRNTTWQAQVGHRGMVQVQIVTLPRADSIALLQRLYPSLSNTYANDIAETVGDLPLALHLAGSYLAKYQGTSFGEPATYLEALKANVVNQLENNAARLKRRPSPTDHTLSVSATFELSWERLRAQANSISELAESLLGLLANFAPGVAVPEAWLLVELPEGVDEQDAIDAIELLQSSGLIERVQSGEVRLHRLIAEMVKGQQSELEFEKQANTVLIQSSPAFGEADYLTKMDCWLPHARYRSTNSFPAKSIERAQLLVRLGIGLRDLAQFREAEDCLILSLMLRKELLGPQHLATAASLNNLAHVYQVTGRYDQALPLLEESLVITQKVRGRRDTATAVCLNDLALIYQGLRQYEQALPYYLESLKIRKEVLGTSHPDTAASLNNLGYFYEAKGDYQRALPFLEESLGITQRVLGTRHPAVATALNNLANLCKEQGEYERALLLCEESLSISREVLGAKHPSTATSLSNLALVFEAQGKYAEAIPLLEEALAIRQEVFGFRHPQTATSLNNLGTLYQAQGEYRRALSYYEASLAIKKDVLGPRHPDTAKSLNNLGNLYKLQGEYEHALPLLKEALFISRESLGHLHPTTTTNVNNLALVYYAQAKYQDALPLFEEALATRKKVLGNHHPQTATSLNNLGNLYKAIGQYQQAMRYYEESLAIRRSVVGNRHPDTATAINNIAMVYLAQKNYGRALPLLEETLVLRKELLGNDHPSTGTSLNNLAGAYEKVGEFGRALPLYKEALAIHKEKQGPQHPDTAISLNNVAAVYNAQGNYADALPLFEESLTIVTAVLGPKHPTTKIVRRNRDGCRQRLQNDLSK